MYQWYFDIGILLILFLLMIGIVSCIILLTVQKIKKRNKKAVILSLIIDFSLFVLTVLHVSSHSTYYKYNDWVILQSNIYRIEQKYGKFDLGEIKQNQRGTVAYYIYTDNGPIMPDHMEHYYYMEYDENGDIYNVYNACPPGG